MPIVEISIAPQTTKKKEEISKVLTEELSRITGIQKQAFTILINEFPPENISVGGKMLSEMFKERDLKNE